MKLNITMKDGSILNDVRVFYMPTLEDSLMTTRKQFTTAMKSNKTIFFSGKYIQRGFIPKQVKSYEFLEHEKSIDELTPLDEESEDIAGNIIDGICTALNSDILKSYVDKLHDIVNIIDKYR
ncbi:hypothetical protein [Clostridium botulinum]|uniref:hypothetical protein n=1 Tax=Clostridium botulinum TaxID=1491 RepID=UPI0004D92ECC|nr:hypothetical protein [Clostridium botulinum]KEH99767.1 hypothetical protein Z952_p0092 [Clostridium botulinum C/D str. BKT75002]KEI05245.1 hypothetical protein Z954_0093 [Clostridium botulinum C/D str. BKT2873]QPW62133.1 hypothetical protein IG390_13855 [Clostridium botulinum]